MAPIDSAPHGEEIQHQSPEPRYPEPKPGEESDEPVRGQPSADRESDSTDRPSLPEQPVMTAADVEDEDADPVIDDGPDIADGVTGSHKRRG